MDFQKQSSTDAHLHGDQNALRFPAKLDWIGVEPNAIGVLSDSVCRSGYTFTPGTYDDIKRRQFAQTSRVEKAIWNLFFSHHKSYL